MFRVVFILYLYIILCLFVATGLCVEGCVHSEAEVCVYFFPDCFKFMPAKWLRAI